MNIREQDLSTFRLSLLGYVLIGGASNGFYQERFWGRGAPVGVWITMALIGGIVVMMKNRKNYHKNKKMLFHCDLIFIISVLVIPLIPIFHDFSLIIMIIYMVAFLVGYNFRYYKKV